MGRKAYAERSRVEEKRRRVKKKGTVKKMISLNNIKLILFASLLFMKAIKPWGIIYLLVLTYFTQFVYSIY